MRLAERVKRLRRDRSLTLEQLAQLTGVSKSMISNIERGDADPTTTVLSRVAEGLEVSISQLLGGDSTRTAVVMRHDTQPVVPYPETGFERRSLSPLLPSRGSDFVMNTLPPARCAGPFAPHHVGVEEYLVAHGRLELRLGTDTCVLNPGDSIVFSGDVEHELRNRADAPCIYDIVIDTYKWR